ncbi:MAG TPA: lysine--tRNA ligase [Actinomycetota bacterium]
MSERYDEFERQRLAKIDALREAGIDPYPVTFDPSARAHELHERFGHLDAGAETGERVRIAGRIVFKRGHGKLSFAMIRDAGSDIQLFCQADRLGDDGYARFEDLDLGDIVGAEGDVIKTKKGELSVRCDAVTLLAKAIRPMPEKWHGLQDVEARYRQRYLDLIVNPDARRVAFVRAKTVESIRTFMAERGFVEVETPMLQTTPGGAIARPFVTHMNALDIDLYLRIAPELYLKRLIVGGFDRVFEINRNFRNEGISPRHNPEFTMLEAYQAYGDYHTMMELMEAMVPRVAQEVLGTTEITWQGRPLSLKAPFRRVRLIDLASEAVGERLDLDMPAAKVQEIAGSRGVPCDPAWGTGKTVLEIYEKKVESTLFEPTFVLDFPRDVSPLARPHRDDPRFTEHFDLMITGVEIGPAYSELTDPIDQRARFEQQARQHAAGDEEAMVLDEEFLAALEYGMPPTGGLGFGVDRFAVILADVPTIREVILFPLLRPE